MDLYDWRELNRFPCQGCFSKFCSSIDIWIEKPHCLNKKIGGADCFNLGYLSLEAIKVSIDYFSHSFQSLTSIDFETGLKSIVSGYHNVTKTDLYLHNESHYEAILSITYPKNGQFLYENVKLIIKDNLKKGVVFQPLNGIQQKLVSSPTFAILLSDPSLVLMITKEADSNDYIKWLDSILLPKLVTWMGSSLNPASLNSNKLISTHKYLMTYSKLKEKYMSSVLEFWNESTNPEKFISEDIAIASYLLVLWEGRSRTFVDLGCGNGLLVYILCSEGHNGFGIDVRARKIWNSYPKSVSLKVSTISPSLECTFPDTEWIIGNHSDELTPWIPLIAARSSYSANFFLLPCCPFELNGLKYLRNNTSKSCYSDYMDYLENICSVCGIEVKRDRLRIPSTKRICLVSNKRLYPSNDHSKKIDSIQKFLEIKIKNLDFTKVRVRNAEEKVRNCTQLNKEFQEQVVQDIANFIIKSSVEKESWREGEFVHVAELIKLLSTDRRKILKDQCGGLQTLLKNHHHIFLVCNGKVKLRKPTVRILPPAVIKKKSCWFFLNHPDSCPLNSEQCTFKHISY